MKIKLNIKNPEKVFASYGKLRIEDFLILSRNKKLTARERKKMENIAYNIKRGTIPNTDLFYTRNKKSITFGD